jgi:hypothetical protein
MSQILAWEDDPGQPDSPNQPVEHPVPDIAQRPLPSSIDEQAPSPGGAAGTPEFRYWAAADALRRVADFWGGILGEGHPWHETVGSELTVHLDAGEELNAYYDREGLNFFHERVAGEVFYSGESPDVVCHEFGHAVLDSVQPRLWDVHSAEPPALHEAFGDMSAMLSALQLPEIRKAVIDGTSGKIDRSSRLSRLAEQLGWAIRQGHPDVVESDCLRNASNSFFYQDPLSLPPQAPASELSSEPHAFSRVFSGAFLNALAGMLATQQPADEDALEKVSQDAGRLLVEAARNAPVNVSYLSQFAAHMIAADHALFGGAYAEALRQGFVKHGILALSDATSAPSAKIAAAAVGESAAEPADHQRIALAGQPYGLDENLLVHPADQPARFNVASAAPQGGAVPGASHEDAAAGYVEDLFRRGHVAVDPEVATGREVAMRSSHPTHEVRREDDALVLARRLFHCGWAGTGE